MAFRRERIEIIITGGRPWGFSIKGGQESNKPLTISKLEKGGKAESAGLYIGDVLYSINNVMLTGSRNEAVQLVRSSGNYLSVEIERGSLPSRMSGRYPGIGSRTYSSQDLPNAEQEQTSYGGRDRDFRTSPEPVRLEPSAMRSGPNPSAVSPVLFRTSSSASLNAPSLSPQGVAVSQEDLSYNSRGSSSDVREQRRSGEFQNVSGPPEVAPSLVKLRHKKARDRGIPTERPRSWHASKHPDFDPSYIREETNMRSPGSGYFAPPSAATRYYNQPMSQPRRRSKGWCESGELKSAYQPEMNGSRDSLISGDSHRSVRSGRLSVSSSRSSGTMSSSRGSLENLLDNGPRSAGLESHPQPLLTSKYKHASAHPQAGIVNQQKSMFERLSHDSTNVTDHSDRVRLDSFSEVERDKRLRDLEKNPVPYHAADRLSPPTASQERTSRKKSRDSDPRQQEYESAGAREESPGKSGRMKVEASSAAGSRIKYSDAKIVKTSFEPQRKSPQPSIPEPPQRDISSVMAVKHHSSRSFTQTESANCKRRSNSPQDRTHSNAPYGRSPPGRQLHSQPNSTEPTHRLTVTRPIEKSVGPGRQERMFGVMSVGDSGNLVAASVTVSPKVKGDGDHEQCKSGIDSTERAAKNTPSRYEHIKDCYTAKENSPSDYVSRVASKAADDDARSSKGSNLSAEHLKSRSDDLDAKSKGKYGSVWKTPQNRHNRARSANFSSVLQNWTSRESSDNQKQQQAEASSDEPISPSSVPTRDETSGGNAQVDSLPSVLRSLQNTQHGERRYQNLEPKSAKDNYEMLWFSESAQRLKDEGDSPPKADPKLNNSAKYKNWRNDYKEVDLDEPADDLFSPPHRYVSDIKVMSHKVLRETSFTRKDLGGSKFAQKQKQLKDNDAKPPSSYHSRSRSFGNDIDDVSSETLTSISERVPSTHGGKPRPKSAGVFRNRTDRHAPVARATVTPDCPSPSNKQSKSDSLSRPVRTSLDDYKLASSSQNRRVSIDVKPESPSKGGGIKSDRRGEVIDFFSKKLGKSPGSDEQLEKRATEKERIQGRVKNSSTPEHANGSRVADDAKATPKSHHKLLEHTSVRKLKNFKETRNKFNRGVETTFLARAKSTSSLIEDEPLKNGVRAPTAKLRQTDRSASLENLLDSASDDRRASSSGEVKKPLGDPLLTATRGHRSKSSPNIVPEPGKTEATVQPPPRKHTKNHRQRPSNSSSASSATTISTLSSYSSSSSTSIGIFPALGEEKEQSRLSRSPPREVATQSATTPKPTQSNTSPKQRRQVEATPSKATNQAGSASSKPANQVEIELRPARVPIDTNTYRVVKRKTRGKSVANHRRSVEATDIAPSSGKLPAEDEEEKVADRTSEAVSSEDQPKETISKSLPAPPPPSLPLDGIAEKLLADLVQKRESSDLPPPPSVPLKTSEFINERISLHLPAQTDMSSVTSQLRTEPTEESIDASDKRRSSGHAYENVRVPGQQYENVCGPASAPKSDPDQSKNAGAKSSEKDDPPKSPPVEISSEPLLPDVPFLHDTATLEEKRSGLTRDIIMGDKALAQVLTTNSKKTLDYMTGVFPQPSHDILEEGIRYRRSKPGAEDKTEAEQSTSYQDLLTNDISNHDNLPASSTYYKTSASKAKILNLMKEKLEGDEEAPLDEQENLDEINHKKVELVLSIKEKLEDFENVKAVLETERRENECLGKQVFNLTKNMCTAREQDKYTTFVQEVDKIINLLLGLSARLARVENAIQMLSPDADKQEMELLCEKRKRLAEQHSDAKLLKESIDKRQKAVSEILASHFDREQFADYEHYIKMKSALIMEQRELDDKLKLGQEQMQCLRDSLPEDWQSNLDKLLEE